MFSVEFTPVEGVEERRARGKAHTLKSQNLIEIYCMIKLLFELSVLVIRGSCFD